MPRSRSRRRMLLGTALGVGGAVLTAGCASTRIEGEDAPPLAGADASGVQLYRLVDRVTWGASTSSYRHARSLGRSKYLQEQLTPAPTAPLPPAIAEQIAAMTITQQPMDRLVADMEQKRKDADAVVNDDDKKAAQQAYQQEMNRLGREASLRFLLRAVYSPAQLQEQMTWFWMNHFNVHQYKSNIRAMVGNYEDSAIRPNCLGKFRDLLDATVRHPAMLRYLDNEQNSVGRINENYARELMELHTLGVGGGYTQGDVQEFARVLTGVGVNITGVQPNLRRDVSKFYMHEGLFEFNPNRHDFNSKVFLGQPLKWNGMAELDEALDRLCKSPVSARFLSRKMAVYLMSDDPPPAVIDRMAAAFQSSEGSIAVTLKALFDSPEFVPSLGRKFKDPVHYVVSSVRLAYDDRPILNAAPMLNQINRLGEQLYGRQTPDGYPMDSASWSSPGQMTTRFEVARAFGAGNAGLFKSEGLAPKEVPAFPQLASALYYDVVQRTLSSTTRGALDQATSPQEWNTYLLASPEMMNR